MSLTDNALHLRSFIDELRRRRDLVDVETEVDTHLELAAITRRVYEARFPAPLFQRIASGVPGARVLGAPAGMRAARGREYGRLALHLGLPEQSGPREIVAAIRAAMRAAPIAPRPLASGPVKQNIWLGDEVDLTRFPVPLLHEHDGGRYFGTYGFHIVRSPDGSWDSWSIGRLMLVDRNTLVGPTIPTQHIGMIRDMWRREGKPTPWAFALGAAPAAVAVAGMPLPKGVSEPGYVGALLGEPIDVVQAETSDLWVPAHAEIVVEGEISLADTALEGPMGEYHGYQHRQGREQPVFRVTAVTFRDGPILPVCVAGMPPEENHTIWGTMISAQLLEVMQAAGLPVDMVWCSYEAATCWAVVSVDVAQVAALRSNAQDFSARVAEVLFRSHPGYLVPKVILVSNDVDVTDIGQVVWALATRAHPLHSHFPFPDLPGLPLVPYLNADDVARGGGGKLVVNCLYPEQFHGEIRADIASFQYSYPANLQRKVVENWQRYGFDAD